MVKKIILFLLLFFILFLPSTLFAAGQSCTRSSDCTADEQCTYRPVSKDNICVTLTGPSAVFGKIIPPDAIQDLGIGSLGINTFLNALITLIYILSAVIFIFMLLWGALEWMFSGGNKEAVQNAQKRITYAIIGIVILAAAFAIISLIGKFTGFRFFNP